MTESSLFLMIFLKPINNITFDSIIANKLSKKCWKIENRYLLRKVWIVDRSFLINQGYTLIDDYCVMKF